MKIETKTNLNQNRSSEYKESSINLLSKTDTDPISDQEQKSTDLIF
uniref:Uncharacterized protein n=1 Tax=Rhizophora mucronata TaxID=61149 RepID=A0A2P2II83_RHIMU